MAAFAALSPGLLLPLLALLPSNARLRYVLVKSLRIHEHVVDVIELHRVVRDHAGVDELNEKLVKSIVLVGVADPDATELFESL